MLNIGNNIGNCLWLNIRGYFPHILNIEIVNIGINSNNTFLEKTEINQNIKLNINNKNKKIKS